MESSRNSFENLSGMPSFIFFTNNKLRLSLQNCRCQSIQHEEIPEMRCLI